MKSIQTLNFVKLAACMALVVGLSASGLASCGDSLSAMAAEAACQTTVTGDMVVKTHPLRPVDRQKTKERLVLAGIATFFLLALAAMFLLLFFDMIKKVFPIA